MLKGPDPFYVGISDADQLEGAALWETVTRQRDKISDRLSWLSANEDHPEFAERARLVTQSRLLWEEQLCTLAAWARVTPGDVAGLLLDQERSDHAP